MLISDNSRVRKNYFLSLDEGHQSYEVCRLMVTNEASYDSAVLTKDLFSISILSQTLEVRRGTTNEFATISFHLVLFSAALVELAKSIPVHSLILSSHLFFCMPLFRFPCPCPVGLTLLNQKTFKHSQTILTSVSWPGSGVRHIRQWLLGSFCEPPNWLHGPYTKCSIASKSISSQKPAFFSLPLQSRTMIHKHTEI